MNILRRGTAGNIARTLVAGIVCATCVVWVPSARAADPLSPAVKMVLDRAEKAISAAGKRSELIIFAESELPEMLKEGLSIAFLPIDIETHVIHHAKSLREETACFQADQREIIGEIEKVQEDIDDAETDGDVARIFDLRNISAYLNTMLEALQRGGLDPEVAVEKEWTALLPNEKEWDASLPEELCFYDSDYAPGRIAEKQKGGDSTMKTYGCDVQTITAAANALADGPFKESVQVEKEALAQAQRIIVSQWNAQQKFGQLQQSIDILVSGGSASSVESVPPEPQHVPAQTGCVSAIDPGVILHELRGPVFPDDPRLIFTFQDFLVKSDERRAIPLALQADGTDVLSDIPKREMQGVLQTFTSLEAALDAATYAAGADPLLALEQNFDELRLAIHTLVVLGNAIDGQDANVKEEAPSSASSAAGDANSTPPNVRGLRSFVRDFAYYLLRSCQDRPCNARLTAILRLVFTNHCFAYGNGQYRNATPEHPQWKQCLCAAMPNAEGCASL